MEGELHPPAYLTIHITLSLLPPLSTLYAHLQVYKVRFRIYDISLTFFSILSTLKSFIAVPSIFSRPPPTDSNTDDTAFSSSSLSATEACALTVEAGLLLDRMIDVSSDGKGMPIPDEWIDEFERIERVIEQVAQQEEDAVVQTPSPAVRPPITDTPVTDSPEGRRGSVVDSLFSVSPRSQRMEDSLSSIEDELGEGYLKKEDTEPEAVEGDNAVKNRKEFDLEEALREDDERVFAKEYHSVPPPVMDEDRKVDHSPFLEQVIAEMEELHLFHTEYDTAPNETLEEDYREEESSEDTETEEGSDTSKREVQDEHARRDSEDDAPERDSHEYPTHSESYQCLKEDDEIDVNALYEDMINGEETDSDDDDPINYSREIQTNSPIFDEHDIHDLDYDELQSCESDDAEDETIHPKESTVIINTETIRRPPSLHSFDSPEYTLPVNTETASHLPPSLYPFDSPDQTSDTFNFHLDRPIPESITLRSRPSSPRKYPRITRTPSPPPLSDPTTPLALKSSALHTKVTEIAHSHPSIALIPHATTFKPTPRSTTEYGFYTLRENRSHSRHSSVSSDSAPETRRVDVGGINLYVRILTDRVMVRVGGGWVDLDSYLREYVCKRREYRRRSGSAASGTDFEFFEVAEGGRTVSSPVGLNSSGSRAGSSLGVRGSPPRNGNGRISAMELRRSVSPAFSTGGDSEFCGNGNGTVGRSGGGTRRVFVRRK